MDKNERTNRFEMHFTESEIKTLAWLCKSEIQVQNMLPERDEELYEELNRLYTSFSW